MIKVIDKEYNPFRILTSKEYFYLKYKLEKEKINDLINSTFAHKKINFLCIKAFLKPINRHFWI